MTPTQKEIKEMQKIYITIRDFHSQLAALAPIEAKYKLLIPPERSLCKVSETLKIHHDVARQRERDLTGGV